MDHPEKDAMRTARRILAAARWASDTWRI